MKSTFKSMMVFVIMFVVVSISGCDWKESNRAQGVKEQESTLERARAEVPTPVMDHFLTRKAVAKYMERMDAPSKLFYVYTMGNNGNMLGYYVAQTRPIPSCTLMTSPDQVYGASSSGKVVVKAPSLDGVYSSGTCGTYFFFDAATDALIELNGVKFQVADQPLSFDVDPIKIAQAPLQ